MFGNTRLESMLESYRREVMDLRREVAELRAACTMPVGPHPNTLSNMLGYYSAPPDTRPVLTAIEACQRLMADAGIEPKEVRAKPARIEFVQTKGDQ